MVIARISWLNQVARPVSIHRVQDGKMFLKLLKSDYAAFADKKK
jgi:hypothetical protein